MATKKNPRKGRRPASIVKTKTVRRALKKAKSALATPPHTPSEIKATTCYGIRSKRNLSQAEIDGICTHLYLTSTMTHADIAHHLEEVYGIKLHPATITKYLLRQKEQWQKQAAQNTDEWARGELAKLDNLERIAETMLHAGNTNDFCKIMLATYKRRSALLGLDKPTKHELTGKDGQPLGTGQMTDEELEAIAKGGKVKE